MLPYENTKLKQNTCAKLLTTVFIVNLTYEQVLFFLLSLSKTQIQCITIDRKIKKTEFETETEFKEIKFNLYGIYNSIKLFEAKLFYLSFCLGVA